MTQVAQAGSAVSDITGMIANIQQMMQQIATAAEEQSAVAEEISQRVTRVCHVLNIKRSGFYAWLKSPRVRERARTNG